MRHSTFHCENCGKPVPLDAEECPHCGSRFIAVECPRCSYVGEPYRFTSGCPKCGYSYEGPQQKVATPSSTRPRRVNLGRKSSLPGWFYTVASIFLLLVLVGLAVIILNSK